MTFKASFVFSDRRSLNNYVECLLLDAVYHEPNETTKAALKEAKSGKLDGPEVLSHS